MTQNKLNMGLKVLLSSVVMLAFSGCKSWDKVVDENTTVEVAEDSNAILEPIKVVGRGYTYIEILSSGVDEDGIDHVTFYAIHNGNVKSRTTKSIDGDVSFREQVRLAKLTDNTVYELRTVCYSVDGKTKSIEKHSVKTFAKTPNDPSNDTPTTPEADTEAPVITLNGASTLTLTVGDAYAEQGASVTDNKDTGLTVTIGGDTVDTSTAWTYTVTYNVSDAAGNDADEVTRTVNVVALPAQNLSISTSSWGIISWANSNNIVADNGSSSVVTDLTINSPYTLSVNQFTFNPQAWGNSETKTTNVLYSWQVVWTKSVTVTWQ